MKKLLWKCSKKSLCNPVITNNWQCLLPWTICRIIVQGPEYVAGVSPIWFCECCCIHENWYHEESRRSPRCQRNAPGNHRSPELRAARDRNDSTYRRLIFFALLLMSTKSSKLKSCHLAISCKAFIAAERLRLTMHHSIRSPYLDIGWQTAIYLSHDMTVRKIELVNWLMEVVVRYALHTAVPKI